MNEKLRLVPLTTQQAYDLWEGVIAPLLKPTVDIAPPWDDLAGLKEDLAEGDAKVFVIMDPEDKIVRAALYCEGHEYRLAKVLRISYAGGTEMPEWIHLYAALRHWAAHEGFSAIAFHGRRGWGRKLKDFVNTGFTQYTDELRDLEGYRQPIPGFNDAG